MLRWSAHRLALLVCCLGLAGGLFPPPVYAEQQKQADDLRQLQTKAETYYRSKEYGKAIDALTRYFEAGGGDLKMRMLLSEVYYASKDFANAVAALHAEIEADEKLKKPPPEERLRFLADCYAQLSNNTGSVWTLERLISYYPKKEYWSELLTRVPRNPGVGERRLLDVFRLKAVTGTLSSAAEQIAMAQLALEAGFPAEAKKIVDQGFAAGLLGTGADAQRHAALRERASRQAAEELAKLPQYAARATASRDKVALSRAGFAYVTYGEYAKGMALMEEGLRITGPQKQGDARLHFGIAHVLAGQNAKAIDVFRTVRGIHGSADLAKLWILYLQQAERA